MRLACHEPGFNERVYEPGHRPRRHLQRFGKDTLRHRPALAELSEQMGAGRREMQRLDCLRHVVVQQQDELEDTIEHTLSDGMVCHSSDGRIDKRRGNDVAV